MTDDAQLRQWLVGHRGMVASRGGAPEDHPDVETLTKHATGQLGGDRARVVTEHLLVCEDGRCVAFVRANAEDVDAARDHLYPPEESEGMHQRTFLCRELLWQQFEEMAREQNLPIDDLVEEAMQAYARQRQTGSVGRAPAASPYQAHDYSLPNDEPDMERTAARSPVRGLRDMREHAREASTQEAPALRPNNPAAMPRGIGGGPPPRAPSMGGMGMPPPPASVAARAGAPPPRSFGAQVPPPPQPRQSTQRMPPAPAPPAMAPPPQARGGGARHAPPPLPSSPQMPGAMGMGSGDLTLAYRGQAYPVTKDHYILGRSKTNADLVLDDSNVSRQHAAIERVGDAWYVVDLGSTNGVYVGGVKITRQRIAEGDVIEITTHQIQCSFR